MLAVASNLFGKPTSLSAYNLHTPAASPASSSTNLPSTASSAKTFNVGLWKVAGATHKTTGKDVSVWVFEKRVLDGIKGDGSGRSGGQAKDWVIEQLKKEATSLSRLRHPDILHMVEPLEESRTDLTFVTETITSSLGTLLSAAAGSSRSRIGGRPPGGEGGGTGEVDLDEVEIQKGTLQIAKGLAFLHTQARTVHLNLSPDAILINAKGDWKLGGLSLTTPLTQPDGSATRYVFPEVDSRLPPQVQWKLDYLAPEYALDSTLTPSSDLYSLGCVLSAVQMGGKPPFQNRGSMQSLRQNAEGSLTRREWMTGSRWDRCSAELKDLLRRLLTRQPTNRISLASLPSHSFFSSLAISTLNFLDATTFASKPREEKATFLRGLVRVVPTFSERLRKGKVLPSLLEEMKDPYLLPFILPNVFEISKTLSKDEFSTVLPKLQPLFALRDPPQNMLTLLEHLSLFEEKTIPAIFRENIMPLIYNSLECEHLPVQEKVLKLVPHLSEILDYGTVQNILLVKVAILFTKTKILSIKIQTLECFTAMVKTLDKTTLTTKLVPLLAKIKTKEPTVMMATLAVQEAMGAKVDREAIATLVLPQLWAMCMGPLLNADQFLRFMTVIKSLGSRVEREHSEHLRDARRLEQQTASYANGLSNGITHSMNGSAGEVDFEALVKGNSSMANPMTPGVVDPWDEGWADGGDQDAALSQSFPALNLSPAMIGSTFPTSFPSSPAFPQQPMARDAIPNSTASGSRLKARQQPSSSFDPSAVASSSKPTSLTPPTSTYLSFPSLTASTPMASSSSAPYNLTPAVSSHPPQPSSRSARPTILAPNYNVSLSPQPPSMSPQTQQTPTLSFMSPHPPSHPSPKPSQSMQPAVPATRPPPGWTSGLMQPSVASKPASAGLGNQSWDDFDPLK